MDTTLSLADLEKFSDNVYEAIIIISKRARQINAEQKQLIERETGINDAMDSYDDMDDEMERDFQSDHKVIRLPKPTQLAIQEFLEGKLKYDYGDEVEDNGHTEK